MYETSYLVADINTFSSDKLPQDSKMQVLKSSILAPEFNIASPRYEAEIILAHVLNTTRVSLHTNPKKEVNDFNKQRYFKLLAMRKNGTPLEYITNKTQFFGHNFYVDKSVLIPRNETEILVEKALELMKKEGITHFIEVGVGSGAVSLSILKEMENAYSIATDISKEALNVAKYNAESLGVKNRCDFVESNLLQSPFLITQKPIPLLLSNPPYIANSYPLNQEVLCEPHIALFGGESGDEILKNLAFEARQKGIKYLICEMGYDQKDSMADFLEKIGYEPEFYKDYAGLDRGFVARLV